MTGQIESEPICVLATLQAGPGRAGELAAAITELTTVVAADEPGTTLFLPSQSATVAGRFVIFERYADAAAVAAHRHSAAMARYKIRLIETGTELTVEFLNPLPGRLDALVSGLPE